MPYGEGAATSWDFEVKVPELDTSVFILPVIDEFQTRKGQERVVVLDAIAREVVEEQRGKHPEFVFTYRGRPTKSIHNWGWKLARERAGLREVRLNRFSGYCSSIVLRIYRWPLRRRRPKVKRLLPTFWLAYV